MSKIAIYQRVSTSDGRQSTDSQEHELRAYCAARGWSDIVIYSDHDSGAKASRTGLDALMKDCRRGRVKVVLTAKLDRIARSLQHLVMLADEWGKLGVALIVPAQGIDTSADSPIGRLQLQMLGAIAEFERSLTISRVKAGIAAYKAKGGRMGRKPLSHEQIEQVKTLRASGKAYRAIATETGISIGAVSKILKAA